MIIPTSSYPYFSICNLTGQIMKSKGRVSKAHQKLVTLAKKAELCESRIEAQKLIKKADKAHAKLTK